MNEIDFYYQACTYTIEENDKICVMKLGKDELYDVDGDPYYVYLECDKKTRDIKIDICYRSYPYDIMPFEKWMEHNSCEHFMDVPKNILLEYVKGGKSND